MSERCEQYYRFFADNAQDFFYVIEKSLCVSFVNRFGAEHLGLLPQDIIGRPLREFFPPDLYARMERNISGVIESGVPASFEDMIQFPGRTMWQDTKLVPLKDESGTVFAVLGISRDITARKMAEAALMATEEKFRTLVEQALVGIYIIQDGSFLYVNPKLADILGYTQEEIMTSKTLTDIVAEEDHELVADYVKKRIEGEIKTAHYTGRARRKDGTVITVEVQGTTAGLNGEKVIIGTLLDITERRRAETEKEYARQFLQSVIDGVSEQVMVIGTDYRVHLLNRCAREELIENNYCYAISHHRDTPCDDEHLCCLREVVRTKKPVTVTHKHYRKDGTDVLEEIYAAPILDESGEVVYVVEALRDITERVMLDEEQKKIKERLFLEQKEQTMVTLAGGIAHEFNNSLMGVLGNAELLMLNVPRKSQEYALADNIVRAADRMAELTRQIQAYARRNKYQMRMVSVNKSINETLLLIRHRKSSRIDIALDLSEGIWPVYADPVQMSQVFINLLMNAFEAMEEKGGTVTIHTENQPNRSAWECPVFLRHYPAGDYVSIRVSDTGPGVQTELLGRIFEPFFTTKFIGRGLGLSAVAGIVQNHHGCISVESTVGKGTTFHLFIPRASENREGQDDFQEQKHAKKILIVEDDIPVSVLLDTMLRSMGYNVVTAPSGMRATEVFNRYADDIVLAILDVKIADVGGKRLCAELKSAKPSLKVLLSSGFDEQTVFEHVSSCGADGYIQKPFHQNELVKMIRYLLP